VPSLALSPSWVGWDHTEPGLWPTPEDCDVDLNAYQQLEWRTASQRPSATACATTMAGR
jgi:hypothetical protein